VADVLEQPVDVRPSGWRRQPPLPTFDRLMTIPKEMAIPKELRIAGVEAFPIRLAPAGADSGRGPSRRDMQPQDVGQDYFISSEGWRSIYSRRHETCLVRIEDDTGKIGWGEGQAPVSPRTVASIVEELLRPMLLGHHPVDMEYLWYRMYSAMRERGHATGFYVDALAGVDLALYDLVGKRLGLPAHRLLGGRYRDRIRVYAGIGGGDAEVVANSAREHVENFGYGALKLHVHAPNREILELLSAVRTAVGVDVELMVDVHGTRDVSGAIELGRGMQELGARWLEAPTLAEDVHGHTQVAAALDLQVATGEWLRTAWEWRPWIEGRAFDVAMPDIARTGLTEGKRIAGLCDTFGLPVAPHVGGGGILSVAASLQFSAAIPNFQILEHSHGAHAHKAQIAHTYPLPEQGAFVVDDTPGLGVDIDEERVRALAANS